jgi:hypothetical protein
MLSTLMIAGALASPAVIAGCYHHGYDRDHGGVALVWSDNESPYYARWEQETHRDHREWAQRNADEQHAYWNWRHDHP